MFPLARWRVFPSLVLGAGLSGCAWVAVATAPVKQPASDDSPAAQAADRAFWDTLHAGRYDQIATALEPLQAEYLAHPNDPKLAAHVAFLHIWRVSERGRLDAPPATITDDIALARRYFQEAVALAPDDARFRGFYAGMLMAEGSIHHDEKLTRQGFFAMGDAVDAWPEFNLFARGYVMSPLPYDDPKYADALEDEWKNVDKCIDAAIDRKNPDFAPYMALERRDGPKRACWNSWIAPHNFEGFFLNMGDMVVKSGDPETGRRLYAQAKLSKQYDSWPLKDVLERRIAQAPENVALFRAPAQGERERRIMEQTGFSCTGCHQEK
jgi:hypothetical protein